MDMSFFRTVSKKIKSEKPVEWAQLQSLPFMRYLSPPAVINQEIIFSVLPHEIYQTRETTPKQLMKLSIVNNKWEEYLSYTKEMLDAAYETAIICVGPNLQKLFVLEYDALFQICVDPKLQNIQSNNVECMKKIGYHGDFPGLIITDSELHLIGGSKNDKHLIFYINNNYSSSNCIDLGRVDSYYRGGFIGHGLVYLS